MGVFLGGAEIFFRKKGLDKILGIWHDSVGCNLCKEPRYG
jgi:hypothetical protein